MSRTTLPGPYTFAEPAPGVDILKDLSKMIQRILAVYLQFAVLLYIVILKSDEAPALIYIVVTSFFVVTFAPTNGVGGAGKAKCGSSFIFA